MTPRWAYVLMFGGPVVFLCVLFVVFAAAEGRLDLLAIVLPAAVGGVGLIAGVSWALWRLVTRRQAAAFAALAAALGGRLRRNAFGEFQLRIPQGGGEVVADLRATAARYAQARGGRSECWTRIAVEDAGLAAGRLELDLGEGEPVPEADLAADVLEAAEALRRLCGGRLRLRIDGTKSPAVVEAWVGGWLEDEAVLSQLLGEVPERLRGLAEASARASGAGPQGAQHACGDAHPLKRYRGSWPGRLCPMGSGAAATRRSDGCRRRHRRRSHRDRRRRRRRYHRDVRRGAGPR